MHAWLRQAARTLARRTGIPEQELELTADRIELLLEQAGGAAHASGARLNAPLWCYLLGRAEALGDADLEELAAAPAPVVPSR